MTGETTEAEDRPAEKRTESFLASFSRADAKLLMITFSGTVLANIITVLVVCSGDPPGAATGTFPADCWLGGHRHRVRRVRVSYRGHWNRRCTPESFERHDISHGQGNSYGYHRGYGPDYSGVFACLAR